MNTNHDFRKGRHVAHELHAHLVFTPKYRHRVITDELLASLTPILHGVCRDFETSLDEINTDHDHLHLLVSYPPKVSLSKLVNSLKGVSSRHLHKHHNHTIQHALRDNHFWSPSYCVASYGAAPLETIKRYIQNQ